MSEKMTLHLTLTFQTVNLNYFREIHRSTLNFRGGACDD